MCIRFTCWFRTFTTGKGTFQYSKKFSLEIMEKKAKTEYTLVLSLCFTLVTLQFARFIFHTKRRENCCYIGFPTEIENMLCSGLFIFNSFSSVLVASSKTPLHPSKLLKEAISILRVWPIPSTHEPAKKCQRRLLLLSHHSSELPW